MPRAGLTRNRVVEAAADLADDVGFENLTVSALARRLGVRDASLYSHVGGLADLRAGVAVLAAGELAARLGPAIEGRAGREALVAFAGVYRMYAIEHPGRYAATQIQLDPEVGAASRGHQRFIEATYGILRAYGLAEPALTDAVRLLRSTFHGFAALEGSGGFGHPRPVDDSWAQILDALHAALEHWPQTHDDTTTRTS
jgi:AcrR family transcriptional regulator